MVDSIRVLVARTATAAAATTTETATTPTTTETAATSATTTATDSIFARPGFVHSQGAAV